MRIVAKILIGGFVAESGDVYGAQPRPQPCWDSQDYVEGMRWMKIRFGVSLGADTAPGQLASIVDHLEVNGVDSLWFSELVYAPAVDPVVGMAYALARMTRLKVGTSVAILPGRHPVLVAKQLASLAAVAPKRVLPVFGLRSAIPAERELFVVPDGERAAVFDESLQVLRAALTTRPATRAGISR
jgi:probable F420-dependent oxidoreductase